MSIHIGILLDLSALDGGIASATKFTRLAETLGIGLVVLDQTAPPDMTAGLDQWTVAAWLAGSTTRIGIGVEIPPSASPEPSNPMLPYPAVLAKEVESLQILAGGRVVTNPAGWTVGPHHATREQVRQLAGDGSIVVVPIDSSEEIKRLATLTDKAPDRRSAITRLHRSPHIDYEGIPESLSRSAIEPGDPDHGSVASTYLRGGAPGLVLRPRTTAEVADAIAFARRHRNIPLGVRSAGHGISGRSTNSGGLVIDVSRMNAIEVTDRELHIVRTGPGATWKRIAETLSPLGLAIGSGDYGGVGVGGLATAAGIGLLSRNHGLTIDHLRSVNLVLADGTPVRASRHENTELFWAVRGAGANFGIATSFEFEADAVGNVGWAQLVLASANIEASLFRYGQLAKAAPRDTTVFLVTGQPRQGRWNIQLFAVVDNPDPNTVRERLLPFLELGALTRQNVVMTPYSGVMGNAAEVGPEGQTGFGEPNSRSAFLPEITAEFAYDAAAMLQTGAVYFFELRAMGGAIGDVAPADAAFSFRNPAFQLAAMGANRNQLSAAWEPLRRHFDGLYLSFETEHSLERLLDAFPAPVLGRLHQLKRRYDPTNLFRDNFNINPNLNPKSFQEPFE